MSLRDIKSSRKYKYCCLKHSLNQYLYLIIYGEDNDVKRN